jgi:RNA polymerase sigma factor (sigma-70 family)
VSLTDAALISRVLIADDHPAFAELVRRYQSPVRGMLRKLAHPDFALADDLAQETFVRAYKSIGSFRGDAQFSTWLYRIAYNVFQTHARRRKESVGIDHEQLAQTPENNPSNPALQHDITAAINRLNDDERIAVLLCCRSGMSHEEAAQILGIPLGTVKTNVLRGKEKLRTYLAAWAP